MKIANNFEEILIALVRAEVEFIIVGGYAVIFHGYGRTTGDMDIWLNPSDQNRKKLIEGLKNMGFSEESIHYVSNLNMMESFVLSIGEEPIKMELISHISGLKFHEVYPDAIPYTFSENLNVKFLDLKNLIINKMISGRLKDQADIEELQKINRSRE